VGDDGANRVEIEGAAGLKIPVSSRRVEEGASRPAHSPRGGVIGGGGGHRSGDVAGSHLRGRPTEGRGRGDGWGVHGALRLRFATQPLPTSSRRRQATKDPASADRLVESTPRAPLASRAVTRAAVGASSSGNGRVEMWPWGGGEAALAFLDGGSEIDLEAATGDRFMGRTTVPNGGGGDPGPGRRHSPMAKVTAASWRRDAGAR
jgi:hypothetical protein